MSLPFKFRLVKKDHHEDDPMLNFEYSALQKRPDFQRIEPQLMNAAASYYQQPNETTPPFNSQAQGQQQHHHDFQYAHPKQSVALKLVLCVVGLCICIMMGCFFYYWHTKTTDTPYIPGDLSPYKEKPFDVGGYQAPHQDKTVYDDFESLPQESEELLPPPEDPMPLEQVRSSNKIHHSFSPGTLLVVGEKGDLIPVQSPNTPATASVKNSTTRKKDHVDHNDDHASLNYDMPTHEALGYAVPKDIPINSNDRLFYVQVQKDLHTEAEAIKKWSLLSKRFSLDDTGSLVKSYVISGKKKYSLLLGPFSDQSEAIRTAKKIGSGAQIVASPH